MTQANADGAAGTPGYARLHKDGLTIPQLSAVDLLAAGKNDTETAKALGLHRVTVTRWRLYNPLFQAALNRQRAEIWGRAIDQLRSLVPKALTVLDKALGSGCLPLQIKAAATVLRIAQLPHAGARIGPTDAEEAEEDLAEQAMARVRRVVAKNDGGPRAEFMRQIALDALLRADHLLAAPNTSEGVEAAQRDARDELRAEMIEEPLADDEVLEVDELADEEDENADGGATAGRVDGTG